MKIPSIIVCAFLLVGSGCAQPKPTMTNRQAIAAAMKELPPSADVVAYSTRFEAGVWQVSLIHDVLSTNISHAVLVAAVRDSDGKVELIKKP